MYVPHFKDEDTKAQWVLVQVSSGPEIWPRSPDTKCHAHNTAIGISAPEKEILLF